MPSRDTVASFFTSFVVGLTAIGIVNLVRWLREPALRGDHR